MNEKLQALAYKLFEVECERQNLLARLDQIESKRGEIQDNIFFLRPLYEQETLDFDSVILVLNPRGADAYTRDQYEKLLTKDIAV